MDRVVSAMRPYNMSLEMWKLVLLALDWADVFGLVWESAVIQDPSVPSAAVGFAEQAVEVAAVVALAYWVFLVRLKQVCILFDLLGRAVAGRLAEPDIALVVESNFVSEVSRWIDQSSLLMLLKLHALI